MAPIPPEIKPDLEAIRDTLSAYTLDRINDDPSAASSVLAELAARLDIAQRTCAYATAFVAQQDLESIRQTVEDDAIDIADIASGLYTSATFDKIAESILSTVGDLELVLEDNGDPEGSK